MAAKYPSSVARHSVGNLTLSVIKFDGGTLGDGTVQDIDNGDTYDSYVPGAVAYWATATDDPTINREEVMVSYSQDIIGTRGIGRFTFLTSEDNRIVNLYVLSKT